MNDLESPLVWIGPIIDGVESNEIITDGWDHYVMREYEYSSLPEVPILEEFKHMITFDDLWRERKMLEALPQEENYRFSLDKSSNIFYTNNHYKWELLLEWGLNDHNQVYIGEDTVVAHSFPEFISRMLSQWELHHQNKE